MIDKLVLTPEEIRYYRILEYGEPVDFSEGFDEGAKWASLATVKKVIKWGAITCEYSHTHRHECGHCWLTIQKALEEG